MEGNKMRFSACACDCCGKVIKEEKIKNFDAVLAGISIKKELCWTCSDKLMVYFNQTFTATLDSVLDGINEDSKSMTVVEKVEPEVRPMAPTRKNVAQVQVKPVLIPPTVKGPLTKDQKELVAKMYEEKKSLEEIAKAVGRTEASCQKYIDKYLNTKKSKVNAEVKEEPVVTEDGRKVDEGKVMALAKAGWNPRRIANDMNLDVDTVKEVLSKNRK